MQMACNNASSKEAGSLASPSPSGVPIAIGRGEAFLANKQIATVQASSLASPSPFGEGRGEAFSK